MEEHESEQKQQFQEKELILSRLRALEDKAVSGLEELRASTKKKEMQFELLQALGDHRQQTRKTLGFCTDGQVIPGNFWNSSYLLWRPFPDFLLLRT